MPSFFCVCTVVWLVDFLKRGQTNRKQSFMTVKPALVVIQSWVWAYTSVPENIFLRVSYSNSEIVQSEHFIYWCFAFDYDNKNYPRKLYGPKKVQGHKYFEIQLFHVTAIVLLVPEMYGC
jgi:hypothetical protein